MTCDIVIKVGGSLLDWPELPGRLLRFLGDLGGSNWLLVPGGGAVADAVRIWDRVHSLGEERSHWLALQAMSLNAQLLAGWLGSDDRVVEPWEFCRDDECRPAHLPHSWDVTSDSIAARIAIVREATELVLLKSADAPAATLDDWVALAFVDRWLPRVLANSNVRLRAVNLRAELPPVPPKGP